MVAELEMAVLYIMYMLRFFFVAKSVILQSTPVILQISQNRGMFAKSP